MMEVGQAWKVVNVMTAQNHEPWTKGWTGVFDMYDGVLVVVDEVPGEINPNWPEDVNKALLVLTDKGLVYTAPYFSHGSSGEQL